MSCSNGSLKPTYELISIEPEEPDRGILNLNHTWSSFANLIRSASTTSMEGISPIDDYSGACWCSHEALLNLTIVSADVRILIGAYL